MTPWQLNVSWQRDQPQVMICGQIDISNSARMRRGLLDLIARMAGISDRRGGTLRAASRHEPADRPGIVIDLAGLEFCDASGLSAFVAAADAAGAAGLGVRVVAAHPRVDRLFRLTGLCSAPWYQPAKFSSPGLDDHGRESAFTAGT